MTDVLAAVVLFILIGAIITAHKRDNTDAPNGGKRSGLFLYTDHGTGVQYVGTWFGGLHVRVDANGNPVKAKD